MRVSDLKLNAIAYRFDKDGQIVRGTIIGPWPDMPNRWEVETARGTERWAQLTILRVAQTTAEADAVDAALRALDIAIRLIRELVPDSRSLASIRDRVAQEILETVAKPRIALRVAGAAMDPPVESGKDS